LTSACMAALNWPRWRASSRSSLNFSRCASKVRTVAAFDCAAISACSSTILALTLPLAKNRLAFSLMVFGEATWDQFLSVQHFGGS
jgi:hypothetical protein